MLFNLKIFIIAEENLKKNRRPVFLNSQYMNVIFHCAA